MVLRDNKGSLKKSVSETKALREIGFYALCSGGKNFITHSAKKFQIWSQKFLTLQSNSEWSKIWINVKNWSDLMSNTGII